MKLQSWPALRARILPLAAKMSLYAERNWKWLTVLLWIGAMAYMVSTRWPQIQWLTLNDTDDNIRYLQVKDWLAGQGWYDLRQYRLDPPAGFDIHWSRQIGRASGRKECASTGRSRWSP